MAEVHVTREQQQPDFPLDQEAAAELIKRIRKLRWIGMDEEAERMQLRLKGLSSATDSVLADQWCTD